MDTNKNINTAPPEYTTPPAYAITPKKQAAMCYNRACMAMLFQFLISNTVMFIASFVYGLVVAITGTVNPSDLVNGMMNPLFLIVVNSICFLIANPLAYLIGNVMTKKYYSAKAFGKIKLPAPDCLLAVLAIVGMQGLSLLIQYGMSLITGVSAVDESTAAMLSFSDNTAQNIVLVIYTVVIAAVTEEILCRGLVLKLLSPVSKTFAIVGSAIIFGVMHGNFAQMFNGFLLGLVLGYAAVKSKSVWLPVLCHMAANANAVILMYFEHKNGEEFIKTELIYAVILVAIAAVSIFFLLKRNGKIDEENDGFPVEKALEIPEEEKPSCKVSLLLKTPCFWIFVAIYVISSIIAVLPQLIEKMAA